MSSSKLHMSGSRKTVVLSPTDVKRITLQDIPLLEKMIDEKVTYDLFGTINITDLITNCYLAMKVEDVEQNMVGAIVFNIYPNVPAVPPWEWNAWVMNLYGLNEINNRNCLWVHVALWDPCYQFLFFRPIIQHMFKIRHFLQYVLLVMPPGTHKIDFLDQLGTIVLPKDCVNPKQCQILYLIQKNNFMIKYKIRRAVEEDNDDLIPLIETNSKRLRELYGSFYIAELLTRHKDSGRQIIVAEYKGVAVAVLILNETVNYQVLNEEFELVPFNGLKKPHPDDVDFSIDILYLSIEQINRADEEVTQIVEKKSLEPSQSNLSVNVSGKLSTSSSEDYSLVFTTGSIFIFQDDEKEERDQEVESTESICLGMMDEYLKIPKKHLVAMDLDTASICGGSIKGKLNVKIPKFLGEDNAFCLEVAAVHPDHESGLLMLFESSFECFPDRDYLIMSMPTTIPMKKLSAIFSRISPRPDGCFPYELFVLHKNTMLTKMKVEMATRAHDQQVRRLLSTIPNQYYIQHQFELYLHSPEDPFVVYVMTSDDQVIGFAALSEEFDVEYLRHHYDLQSAVNLRHYKTGRHGLLESLVVSPVFEIHAKFFLRELHRLSDFSILYYKHISYFSGGFRDKPLLNMLPHLFPIMPRKKPDYNPLILKEENCPISSVIMEEQDPFALYLSVMPLCSVYKYTVNTKIVVIGSSHTALSFLESLLLTQDIKQPILFNNVTMVGTQGFNNFRALRKVRESFTVQKYFMDTRRMDMISLRTYVNVINGKVTKIDRKEQVIYLGENVFVPYDLLFLMTGEIFRRPFVSMDGGENPENIFVVNNAVDANRSITKLKELIATNRDPDYIIVVYGHFLQAKVLMHGLITFGVPGSHIVLVEPFPYTMAIEKRHRHNVTVFNDPDIDEAILEGLKAEGIEMYFSYYFIGWDLDQTSNSITMAKFESKHHMLEVPCTAMFYFNEKGISPRVYKYITEAGLVFDGRLVIDPKCQTNDPRIYGAGTLTKYSRKYYASQKMHKYFNRVEIGYRLGQQIKEMLIPKEHQTVRRKSRGFNIKMERGDSLVPRYVKPIMRYCRLPGGLYYLSIVKPGKRVPLETAINLEQYGQVLITGTCKNLERQGYFRLHLNTYKTVETITCIAKFPMDIHNLYCLWGKHEKLLNNLQLRFEMALITDLFDYFKEPWAYAIYHDKFEALLEDLNNIMTSTVGVQGHSLVSSLLETYKRNKWKPLSQEQMDILEEGFNAVAYPKLIEKRVLEFIREHLDSLPMYAHPFVVKAILEGFNKSPMFAY